MKLGAELQVKIVKALNRVFVIRVFGLDVSPGFRKRASCGLLFSTADCIFSNERIQGYVRKTNLTLNFPRLTEENFSFNDCSSVAVMEMLKGIDMEAIQLRSNFHRLIDKFSDIKMLEQLYEVISEYQNRKAEFDILDELTKDQQVRLRDSIKQAQTGRTVSDVRESVKDWLTK